MGSMLLSTFDNRVNLTPVECQGGLAVRADAPLAHFVGFASLSLTSGSMAYLYRSQRFDLLGTTVGDRGMMEGAGVRRWQRLAVW
jgi:hypothetical protein